MNKHTVVRANYLRPQNIHQAANQMKIVACQLSVEVVVVELNCAIVPLLYRVCQSLRQLVLVSFCLAQ